jgi:adenylate cyclase
MQKRLDEVNHEWENLPIAQTWRAAGKDRLKARIGIHSGKVVAGNLGSKTRMKYGLIGDVVNVAARIEALNKKIHTTLLCSDDTRSRIGEELAKTAIDRGEHEVKGRAGHVRVWGF